MKSRAYTPIAVFVSGLVLAACAAGPVATPSAIEQPVSNPPVTEETPLPSTAAASITEAGIAALLAAAADDAGVDIDEIRLVTAEEVTWPDGSLGCPAPGMAYTQALVPGYRVVVEIGGEELHFHAAQGGEFRFCDDPQPPVDGR